MINRNKYRVWTGDKMEYNVVVGKFGTFYVNPGANGDGLDEDDTASLTPFTTIYDEDTPVMQFTGEFDKNGVEIYDGDLIKGDGYGPYRVFWDTDKVGWCSCCYDDADSLGMYRTIEVVGHIFDGTEYEDENLILN